MSDPDRDPYPNERPLTLDDRRGSRGGGPAPVTLIVSLLVLALVAGGVFLLYRGGARGANDAPQPVGAPLRDVKTVAPPQAPTADPAAGLSIYKQDPGAAASAPAFVAPPEEPAARVPSPPAAQSAPAAPSPAPINALPPQVAAPAMSPSAKPGPGKTATAKSASAPGPDLAAPASKSGQAVVQIGAFPSRSLADRGWGDAAAAAPAAMAGKGKRVAAVVREDGTTLYRTAITGFDSRDEAQGLCDKLKAAGKSCFVR